MSSRKSKRKQQRKKLLKGSGSNKEMPYERALELEHYMYRDAFDDDRKFFAEKTALEEFEEILKYSEQNLQEDPIEHLRKLIIKQHPEFSEKQIQECIDDTMKRVTKEFPELFKD